MTLAWGIAGALATVLVGLAAWLLWPLRRPMPTESDYSHHNTPWWQLYYANKYLGSIKGGERGAGLEEKFSGMTFEFDRSPLTDSETITVKATGDLMVRQDLVGEKAERLWDDIGDYLFDGDLVIGNMEFAVNPDWVIWELIRFSVPPEYALPLLGTDDGRRFDLVSLANNHINDTFTDGIVKTCDWLDSIEMTHVGANRTPGEQDEFPIIECKGARIAVLSYTFSTNNVPLDEGFGHGTNLVRFNALNEDDYDPSLIHEHIDLAKARGADYIISCHHWGLEFEYYPPARIVQRAEALFEAGIDLIIGHHPHGLNPVGHHRTSDGRDCLAFYSLGNLTAAGLPFAIQKLSELAEVVLETGLDSAGRRIVRPSQITLTPTWFTHIREASMKYPRILPVKRLLAEAAEGKIPAGLTGGQLRRLRKVNHEFDKYFCHRAIESR